jgi:galactokinase
MALEEEIPWPRDWRLALAFSGVRAEKTREALEKYNMASRRARTAVDLYNGSFGTRFANLGEAVRAGARAGDWSHLDKGPIPGLVDRVRQFVMEDTRIIPRALSALRSREREAFGKELSASHRASARFLWNIVPEVDHLQSSALALGAAGASGFGAGFGGSIMAVVQARESRAFISGWRARYHDRHPERGQEASFLSAAPAPGIEVWSADGPRRLVDLVFR